MHSPTQAATLASRAISSQSGLASAGISLVSSSEALTFSRSHQGSVTPSTPTPRGPVSHLRPVA